MIQVGDGHVPNANCSFVMTLDTIVSSDNHPSDSELLRIPLLKDVFERYPTTPINIDIKVDNDDLIKQVSELIQQYRREHITLWGSFSHTICRKLTVQVSFAALQHPGTDLNSRINVSSDSVP